MLSNIEKDGKILVGKFEGPQPGLSVLMVVDFVEKNLLEFAKNFSQKVITNEKGLTQELCILLNRKARKSRLLFYFEKEYMEDTTRGDSPTVDMAVLSHGEELPIDTKGYGSSQSFFSIEAKRLDNISKTREKEYLVGRIENSKYRDCGGVERFKKEIHGKGLKSCALIGYVQEHDFDYWYLKLNSWIDELIIDTTRNSVQWTDRDRLVEVYRNSTIARFTSENQRQNNSIFLYHLWVMLE